MLVWNDIAKYTNDYKNGIKKLDDMVNDSDKTLNNKLNHKKINLNYIHQLMIMD